MCSANDNGQKTRQELNINDNYKERTTDMGKETGKRGREPWTERIDRWAASDWGSWTMSAVFALLMAAAFFFGGEG